MANALWMYEIGELASMSQRGLMSKAEIAVLESMELPRSTRAGLAARNRRKQSVRVCGHWPATQRQINDAISLRPAALTMPVPFREKPSEKLARLAREAQARKFEAWRNAQRKD